MDITDIQSCAYFFQDNYLKTFYLVITYNGSSFILIGEKANFPHLMGIQNNTHRSNGYNSTLSSTKLNNVDVPLTDINTGYMLGWVSNSKLAVNANINMEKYCICTWIDESTGTQQNKEKYMPSQDVELIRFVFALDENSKLVRKKRVHLRPFPEKSNT